MRTKGIKSFISIILSVVLMLSVLILPVPARADVDTAKWTQDINQMRELVEPIYFSGRGKIAITKEDFKKSCDALIEKLPKLNEQEIALEMSKTIALLNDAHASPAYANFTYYPMYLYWLDDGAYLVQTTSEYSSVLNMKLAKVGGMPFDQALALIEPYISHNNEYWVRHVLWNFISNAQLLKHVGITKTDESCDFTFVDDEGNEKTVTAKPIVFDRNTKWVVDSAYEKIIRDDPPLCYQGRYYYFFKYLPNSGVMYVNYKKCMETKDYPFSRFMSDLLSEWKQKQPTKLVLDIRFNSGGSTNILMPLINWVKGVDEINKADKFYVITGRRTFSAGVQNAAQLYMGTNATFVGEATGQNPNHWGEVRSYALNNSKMGIYLSSKYMVIMPDSDPETIEPDFSIPWNHQDYFKGIDTILNMIVADKLPPNPRMAQKDTRRVEAWTNDLRQVQTEIMLKITEFSKYCKPQELIDQIDILVSKIPNLSDLELSLELSKIIKMFKNPNFTVSTDPLRGRTYQLGIQHHGDGIYVNLSNQSNESVFGKKIVAISGFSMEKLAEKFAQYFYFTDFEQFCVDSHLLLFEPDVLSKLGVLGDKARLDITVEDFDGKRQDITLKPLTQEEAMKKFVILPDYTKTPKPFYKREFTGEMWNCYISDKKTLYVNFLDSGLSLDSEQKFQDFKRSIENHDIKTVVFDYRFTESFTTGFRNTTIPFYEKLSTYIDENKGKFKFYAIIDKLTSENGVYDVAYLKKHSDITVVGQTPARKPASIYSFMTASSQNLDIALRIPSKRYFVDGYSADESIVPDKEIIQLGKHYFNGIDPVMDWILAQ